MGKTEFARALREADALLSEPKILASLEKRLRRRLRCEAAEQFARRSWVQIFAIATAGAAIIVGAWTWSRAVPDSSAGPMLGGLAVGESTPDFRTRVGAGDLVEVDSGEADLIERAWRTKLRVRPGAAVRRERTGLRVVRGRVDVAVDARPADGAPARVLVSHGTIEVLGTRFTVWQESERGSVTLHEGTIRFLAADGRERLIRGTGELSWPLLSEPPAPRRQARAVRKTQDVDIVRTAASARTPRAVTSTHGARRVKRSRRETFADAIRRRVAELRSLSRYAEAAAVLRRALGRRLPAATRERLSFELGSILTVHLGDRRAACSQWRLHLKRYPAGRYDREAAQARVRLGCVPAGANGAERAR